MTGWQREGNRMSRDACVVPSGGNSIVLGDEYSTTWTPSFLQGVVPMGMPAGDPQANTKVLLYRVPPIGIPVSCSFTENILVDYSSIYRSI